MELRFVNTHIQSLIMYVFIPLLTALQNLALKQHTINNIPVFVFVLVCLTNPVSYRFAIGHQVFCYWRLKKNQTTHCLDYRLLKITECYKDILCRKVLLQLGRPAYALLSWNEKQQFLDQLLRGKPNQIKKIQVHHITISYAYKYYMKNTDCLSQKHCNFQISSLRYSEILAHLTAAFDIPLAEVTSHTGQANSAEQLIQTRPYFYHSLS